MSNDELERASDPDPLGEIAGLQDEVTHPEIHFCSFNVGEKRLTVPIEVVKEITDPVDVLPLPGTPAHIQGLLHLRGAVIPVVDLAEIYGTHYHSYGEKKLIIIDVHNELIAFLSDGMPDLLEEQDEDVIDVDAFFNRYKIA